MAAAMASGIRCVSGSWAADLARRISARGVEIAQRHRREAVSPALRGDHPFAGELGVAVRAGRSLGAGFGNGLQRPSPALAVDRRAGGEDQPIDAPLAYRREQRHRPADVDVPEKVRPHHRAAHLDQAGEVDDRLDRVRLDRFAERARVTDVAVDEFAPAHRLAKARREIVIDDRKKALLVQGLGRVCADVAGSARDQHGGLRSPIHVAHNSLARIEVPAQRPGFLEQSSVVRA